MTENIVKIIIMPQNCSKYVHIVIFCCCKVGIYWLRPPVLIYLMHHNQQSIVL